MATFTTFYSPKQHQESIWMALQDSFDQYLPSTISNQLARFPLITTISIILFLYAFCSTCFRIQRTTSLPFRLINRAYGLYELITHTLPFSPIGFSSFSPNPLSRNQDPNRKNPNYHFSVRLKPASLSLYIQFANLLRPVLTYRTAPPLP